jgi:HEAT repeat protein
MPILTPLLQSGMQTFERSLEERLDRMIEDADRASYGIVHVCIFIIIVCLTSTVVVTFYLFAKRIRTQRKLALIADLTEKYDLLLTGIIFDDMDEEFEAKRQKLIKHFRKKYLTGTFNKRVLRKQLLKLHKNLAGSAREVLSTLYCELNLHKDALSQLGSTDWSEKADAVRELSQMEITEARSRIIKLTSHENEVLRLEAQVAMLMMDKENPFGFLEKKRAMITDWQQLNLEETVKKIEIRKIPLFSKWFTLKNPTSVQFCIKMTAAYNQFESAPELIRLLSSKHERIVKEAVIALGNMMIPEAPQPLFDLYPRTSLEIKNEIIMSLGKIAGDTTLVFLSDLVYKGSHHTALKAAIALKMTGYDGELILKKALESELETAAAVSLHVLDERI